MLIVGRDKTELLRHLPDRYLFIDDGKLLADIPLPRTRTEIARSPKITCLDFSKHRLNPLQGIDYPRACDFIDVLDAAFPRGDSTLTKDTGLAYIFERIRENPASLETLIPVPDKSSPPGHIWAHAKIQRLIHSPILRPFLTKSTKLPLDGILLAKLDHTIPRFDRFFIANLLIANYQGHVVISDFGQYGHQGHLSLIDEGRLSAGVNFLDEPKSEDVRNALLLMSDRYAAHCTYDDAVVLAKLRGLIPDPMREDCEFNRYVKDSVAS